MLAAFAGALESTMGAVGKSVQAESQPRFRVVQLPLPATPLLLKPPELVPLLLNPELVPLPPPSSPPEEEAVPPPVSPPPLRVLDAHAPSVAIVRSRKEPAA
jgi:hypothetical protein